MCGIQVRRIGDTGIVADLEGRLPGPTFAIRADMDCLPIHELNDLPYKSKTPGLMHACGHDGHTSVLVGAARVLCELQDSLPGKVRFIFQPSEENVQGAKKMIEGGAMDGVDGIIALHDWNDTEPGNISIKAGPILASADTFTLRILGTGGHAAYPHLAVDQILVGAHLVTSIQTIVSREMSPLDPVVVTVGAFNAGFTDNVIPAEAVLKGTVRTLNPTLRESMPERLERIVAGVCASFRAEYKLDYTFGCTVTMNEREMSKLIADTASDLLGPDHVRWYHEPSMGGEDFSEYLRYAPGAMFLLGIGGDENLHSPRFNFNDASIPTGIAVLVETARRFLSRPVSSSVADLVGRR
jgi:amidohydrolase